MRMLSPKGDWISVSASKSSVKRAQAAVKRAERAALTAERRIACFVSCLG